MLAHPDLCIGLSRRFRWFGWRVYRRPGKHRMVVCQIGWMLFTIRLQKDAKVIADNRKVEPLHVSLSSR